MESLSASSNSTLFRPSPVLSSFDAYKQCLQLFDLSLTVKLDKSMINYHYKKLAKDYHPDAQTSKANAKIMAEVIRSILQLFNSLKFR